jgi:hypothetical protein
MLWQGCYNIEDRLAMSIPTLIKKPFQKDKPLPKTNYQYEKRQKELEKKKKKAEKMRLKEEKKAIKPEENPGLSSEK